MSFEEFAAFMAWAKSVMTNKPTDINPYLAQELRAHLRGEVSPIEPDRIARAFEYIHRHGQEEGIKRLEKTDSKLAKKIKATRK